MANQISGVIVKIDTRSYTKKDQSAGNIYEVILDASRYDQQTGQKYENYPSVEIRDVKWAQMPQMAVGMRVRFDVEISGRFYDKKDGSGKGHINSINAYKAEIMGQAAAQAQTPQYAQQAQPAQQAPAQPWGQQSAPNGSLFDPEPSGEPF